MLRSEVLVSEKENASDHRWSRRTALQEKDANLFRSKGIQLVPDESSFETLKAFLARVPAVQQPIGVGALKGGGWYAKFGLDIHHKLAWNVVQELGHVLNYVSVDERLPTVFMPVSPPPYMNGGPEDYLSWVIECRDTSFVPDMAAQWLRGRLPTPVDDERRWL
jgi:hypothetical protein